MCSKHDYTAELKMPRHLGTMSHSSWKSKQKRGSLTGAQTVPLPYDGFGHLQGLPLQCPKSPALSPRNCEKLHKKHALYWREICVSFVIFVKQFQETRSSCKPPDVHHSIPCSPQKVHFDVLNVCSTHGMGLDCPVRKHASNFTALPQGGGRF